MSRPIDVLAVMDRAWVRLAHVVDDHAAKNNAAQAAGYEAAATDLHEARAAVAELADAAECVRPYLVRSDAALYRNAAYQSRAQALRYEADEIERKDAAIARFNAALAAVSGVA